MPAADNKETQPVNSCNSRRTRGFTLIELLVVFGILLVLMGLAVYSFTKLDPSDRLTKTNLSTCKAMFSEFEAVAGVGSTPIEVFVGSSKIGKADASFGDFWIDPKREDPEVPTPINSPGVTTGTTTDAVRNTLLAMSVLQAIPANRDAMTKMPPSSIRRFSNDAVTTIDDTKYPLIADGWGNPIIFVPGNGITGIKLGFNAASNSWAQTGQTIVAPDNRPFFASAGPDGDMTAGDDNLYSFQP
jgi:prepilin-type N-terminal cleavage/methylation domain-containing protein